MLTKTVEQIYLEYLPGYKAEVEKFRPSQLQGLINKSAKNAKRNYRKLSPLKTCSLGLYTTIWIRQEVERDLANRAVQKISSTNPPSLFKAQIDYFSLVPHELHRKLRSKLYNSPPERRKEVWRSFNLPLEEIEEKFVEMIISHNEFARTKGYGSYLGLFLDKYKIPQSDFKKFTDNAERLVEYYNRQLPKTDNLPAWFYSKFNIPCWVCRLSTFPFSVPKETLDHAVKKYKVLDQFKHKLEIKPGDSSSIFYKKEADRFEITIDKTINSRHQSMELVHELSHAVNYLLDLKKGTNPFQKGPYQREKETLKTELLLLKTASPVLYRAHFGEALLLFQRTLFEIELYKNPKQDLGKLYAKIFNRCFKNGEQKKNPLYFLDERITIKPFSSLPHTIAHAAVFLKRTSLA